MGGPEPSTVAGDDRPHDRPRSRSGPLPHSDRHGPGRSGRRCRSLPLLRQLAARRALPASSAGVIDIRDDTVSSRRLLCAGLPWPSPTTSAGAHEAVGQHALHEQEPPLAWDGWALVKTSSYASSMNSSSATSSTPLGRRPSGFGISDHAYGRCSGAARLSMSPTARRTEIDVNCPAPGLMEALDPGEDESHGGTEEVPRRAAGAGDPDGGRRPA